MDETMAEILAERFLAGDEATVHMALHVLDSPFAAALAAMVALRLRHTGRGGWQHAQRFVESLVKAAQQS